MGMPWRYPRSENQQFVLENRPLNTRKSEQLRISGNDCFVTSRNTAGKSTNRELCPEDIHGQTINNLYEKITH